MKPIVLVLLLATAPENDPAREVALVRAAIEDAGIRYDDEGLRLGRERAARLAAAAEAVGDARLARDAHYLVGLAAWAQVYTGHNGVDTLRRLIDEGTRHAARAAALDERFADAYVLGATLRGSSFMVGGASAETRRTMIELLRKAVELDAEATPVATIQGLAQSIDPAGPARPQGIAIYDDLVARLDAARTAASPPPGFWEVQARAWHATVRLQTLQPEIARIRADVARLVASRPDAEIGRELAARVEHRSWVPAAAVEKLAWRPLGEDPAGDGTKPEAPDLRALAFARDAERIWFRLTFEQALPPAFGVNVVVDRDGDARGDAPWWGGQSSFRFDRLVTAWVVGEGDGYFGRLGVTDANGAIPARLSKLSTDVVLRVGDDRKSVMLGVPASPLELTERAKVIAAGGTHLMWNDNLTAADGGGIALPAQ